MVQKSGVLLFFGACRMCFRLADRTWPWPWPRKKKTIGTYVVRGTLYTNETTSTEIVAAEDPEGSACAIKIGPFDTTMREYSFASALDHPAVVRPMTLFARESRRGRCLLGHMVLPLLAEDLLEVLARRGRLESKDVRTVAWRMVSALRHIHSRGVVHRDVKVDNIMLGKADNLSTAKLIDFGLAEEWPGGVGSSGPRGTPSYIAPEAWGLSPAAHPAADMLGVTLYALMRGRLPYEVHGTRDAHIISIILTFDFVADSAGWDCPDEQKDFVLSLLRRDPATRASAAHALLHPFLRLDSRFSDARFSDARSFSFERG